MAEQGTLEWKMERVAKVTASRVHTIVARQKNGSFYADRETYAYELALERLTGEPTPKMVNEFMEWGTRFEPEAANAYATTTFDEIAQIGFVPHPVIRFSGASPDRLVGDDGLAEFKCPSTKTHINTLRSGEVPKTYFSQMQWQMACMPERQWCDFVSYDPRMPEKGRMFIKRVERDNLYIATLEEAVSRFLSEDVEKIIREIEEAMEKL